jgi:hypothetical protein
MNPGKGKSGGPDGKPGYSEGKPGSSNGKLEPSGGAPEKSLVHETWKHFIKYEIQGVFLKCAEILSTRLWHNVEDQKQLKKNVAQKINVILFFHMKPVNRG